MKATNGTESELFIKVPMKWVLSTVLSLMIWFATCVWWAASTNTTLKANVTALTVLSTKVDDGMGDRYYASDAKEDFAAMEAKHDRLAERVSRLE